MNDENISTILTGADMDCLPMASAGSVRVTGEIKTEPEDFVVDEIPAYPFAGEGEHVMVRIKKRDVPGGEMLRQISTVLGIPDAEIGTAGTKDKRAVTCQWISVPARCADRLERINGLPGLTVVEWTRHTNKLKSGHLRGNRFEILVRGADVSAVPELQKAAETISRTGFPNIFGSQRFGRNNETLVTGLKLLGLIEGARDRNMRRVGGFERRMAVSAVQSALFNIWLKNRYEDGLTLTALKGDVMEKTATGGLFTCSDPVVDQGRIDSGEIAVTGPMFGNKMMAATDDAGERELAVLSSVGFDDRSFAAGGKLAEGTRRGIAVIPEDLTVSQADGGVLFCFFLPKGCYASVLMREFVSDTRGIS